MSSPAYKTGAEYKTAAPNQAGKGPDAVKPAPPRPLVLVPMALEARRIRRRLEKRGIDCPIVQIGLRAKNLPDVRDYSVQMIILAGLAGGLDPNLEVGDVVIDAAEGTRHSHAMRPGKIGCSSVPLCTPS